MHMWQRYVLTIALLFGLTCIYSVYQFNQPYKQSFLYKNIVASKQARCDVIHIGVVCTGYKSNVKLYTMLKTIFFYRNNPIHFHIMVNEISETILNTLFETWAVPQVEVSFYNINHYVSSVKWIPNKHYSGIYGLLKLMFPKAISTNVTTKIIILDTDLTFMGDIYNLWHMFDDFNKTQAIGLVEHQNDYYLGKLFKAHPWPALGRGFNTGVILFHLKRLESMNWDLLWATATNETIPHQKVTDQADQDIINAVIKKNSSILYFLPCQWNIQLTDHTNSSYCYNSNKAEIFHWNSPKKINVINEDGESFRAIHKLFLVYDGDLLRRQLPNCLNVSNINTQKPIVDACYKLNEAIALKRRSLLFFREFKYTPRNDDVTFVSQLSFDRLQVVEELSRLWDGPMSLTFYVTDSELHKCLEFIENSKILRKRLNIAYHAVFKRGNYSPMNELRNISLHTVATPYVFLVDTDMLPPKELYWKLKKYVSEMPTMYKRALVVAAFETTKKIPQTKAELLNMIDSHTVIPFHFKDNHREAYAPTNYTKWRTANKPYKVNWAFHFEPYVIVQSNVTGYDKRFLEYDFERSPHIMELQAQGYEFLVLPDVFIVHKAYPKTKGLKKRKKEKKLPQFRECLQTRMQQFTEELNKKYNRKFKTNE